MSTFIPVCVCVCMCVLILQLNLQVFLFLLNIAPCRTKRRTGTCLRIQQDIFWLIRYLGVISHPGDGVCCGRSRWLVGGGILSPCVVEMIAWTFQAGRCSNVNVTPQRWKDYCWNTDSNTHARVWVIWILFSDSARLVQFDINVCMQLERRSFRANPGLQLQISDAFMKGWNNLLSRCLIVKKTTTITKTVWMRECKPTFIQTPACERWKLQFLLQVAAARVCSSDGSIALFLFHSSSSVQGFLFFLFFFFCAPAARSSSSSLMRERPLL